MRTNRDQTLKAALCTRVSSSDMDQNPKTQSFQRREFVTAQGLKVYREHVGQTSTTAMAHRHHWRPPLVDASERKLDVVVVWRMDPGFRSVMSAAATLLRPLDTQNPNITEDLD